jgi:hypothetical protein
VYVLYLQPIELVKSHGSFLRRQNSNRACVVDGAWILLLFFARFHFRRQLETIVSAVEQLWVSFLREERERERERPCQQY